MQKPKASLDGASQWLGRKLRKLRTTLGVKPAVNNHGFDGNELSREHDVLGRYRIAEEVYRLLKPEQSDWSVRVGLLGEWGSGKTTIAKWVAKLGEDNGAVVIWFNPWSATTIGEVWIGLGQALHAELEKRGVTLSIGPELKMALNQLRRFGGAAVTDNPVAKGYTAAVDRLLRVSANDIKAIRAKLGDARVLVIVDDLDRADPLILPKLLLAMREVFDLPQFSFLVPFSKAKVAKALESYHEHWNGEDFLEKIFDYQIAVPEIPVNLRWDLFATQIQAVLPNIPLDQLIEVKEFLPDNARSIKRLVRAFTVLKEEIARHGKDEIDWASIVYGAMLRAESESFFTGYVKEAFFGDQRLHQAFASDRNEKQDIRKKRIEDLAKKTVPEADRDRVINLAVKWDTARHYSTNTRVAYTLKLFDSPDALTWREFDDLLKQWIADPRGAQLNHAITSLAARRNVREEQLIQEIIESTANRYLSKLEAASQSFTREDHRLQVASARDILGFADAITQHLAKATDEQRTCLFVGLARAIASFAHFNGNDADRDLRIAEEETLKQIGQRVGTAWPVVAKQLELRNPDMPHIKAFNEVCGRLAPMFDDKAARRLSEYLAKEDGLFTLLKYGEINRPADMLMDATSQVWNPAGASPMDNLLASASSNAALQKNIELLLRLAFNHDATGLMINAHELAEKLKQERIAVAFWNAAIATPLQYRNLSALREVRTGLVSNGIAEDKLEFPEWLKQGME